MYVVLPLATLHTIIPGYSRTTLPTGRLQRLIRFVEFESIEMKCLITALLSSVTTDKRTANTDLGNDRGFKITYLVIL